MTDLPPGWEWATLEDVADVTLGQSPPGSSYNTEGDGMPFFQGKAEFGELRPEVRKWTTAVKKTAQTGDVLLSVRAPVGPTNLAPTDCAIGRGLASLHSLPGVSTMYLLWVLRFTARTLAEKATGTTFPAVSGSTVRAHAVPIAPAREQERIVAAIEEHLSRLDAAEAQLHQTAHRLAALSRSILAQAQVEGAERELGDLLLDIEAGRSFKTPGRPASAAEWGVVKVSAMTWGAFREEENKAVPDGAPVQERFEIREGDLLLSRANTSGYVGATVLVGRCRPRLLLSDKSMRLHPRDEIDRRWLLYALSSPCVRHQMSVVATGTSDSMRNISQAKVRSLRIRVPSHELQVDLAARIAMQLEVVERARQAVEAGHLRCTALRRSILAAAFSGKLGPQDPGDEPASVLLERIRAERAAAPKPPRRRATASR